MPQFTHPSSIQWMYSRNTFAVLHFFYFQIVPESADFRPALPQPGSVPSTDCTSTPDGPRRSKTNRSITTCDRSINTQTQEFWHGRRKGKGFNASLVMLQERSQVLCKLYSLWNSGSRKKSLDVSFLTVPKLPSRYLFHFIVSFVIKWVIDSARISFYTQVFTWYFYRLFFLSHLTVKKILKKNTWAFLDIQQRVLLDRTKPEWKFGYLFF